MNTSVPKHIEFDGISFCRDDKTGYYCKSVKGRVVRLHRYVWEKFNCKIPKGYDIHHIDGNKANNDISNLRLLSRKEHRKVHTDALTSEQREWFRNNIISKAVPAAKAWHRTHDGRDWHKRHYEKMKDKFHVRKSFKCAYCGKDFIGSLTSRFCSNACKSAWRRKSGVDNVERVCPICGKKFMTNKYSPSTYCCKSCSNRGRWV